MFTEFSRHMEKNLKNKNQVIWMKGKNKKNHISWQENQCHGKKRKRTEIKFSQNGLDDGLRFYKTNRDFQKQIKFKP